MVAAEKLLQKTPFAHLCLKTKTYSGCVLDCQVSKRYKDEIFERFKARQLPVKTILNEKNQQQSLCLFQKNVTMDMINSYLMVTKKAFEVSAHVDSFIGVENQKFVPNEEEQFLPSRLVQKQSRFER